MDDITNAFLFSGFFCLFPFIRQERSNETDKGVLNAFNGMLCILISENESRSLILNNMRAKVEFGTPEKARVKFPHSLILHFAFSSWIEKIMTKTRHCHWENRFVLAVRKFYQGEFSRSSVGQFWCILLYVWSSSERVCLQICHCIGYGKSVMSPQHGVILISSVRVIVLTLVKQCGSEIRTF